MSPQVFRVLLDLFMCSDPWPMDDSSHAVMLAFVESESKRLGFSDWIEAFHGLEASK